MKECYETAHQIAYTIEKYSEEFDWKLRNALENLSKVVGSAFEITDAARKEVVSAVGYRQGHLMGGSVSIRLNFLCVYGK